MSGPVQEMAGIRVGALVGDNSSEETKGWNETERNDLRSRIAARQPFLDFASARINSDGSQQLFRVSGEPVFDRACNFIGYRGIGLEVRQSVLANV